MMKKLFAIISILFIFGCDLDSDEQENLVKDTFYCGTWNDSQDECIHGNRPIVDDYIYFVTRDFGAAFPAINYHIWKVNIDDFTDYSLANLSYADHGFPNDLFYSKTKDKLYIVYCSIGTKITEVDPETLVATDIIIDMPTSIINASMWIDEEDQQLYITGFYDEKTKVYQYNMNDWSLANTFSETPNHGHSVVTDNNYVYVITAGYGEDTVAWRLSKDMLEKVSLNGDGGIHIYTNGDVIGGSHCSRVHEGYLWFGLHGEKGGEEVSAGIVRIDVNDLSSYTKIELPDYNGATYGTTYYNGYLWFTIGTTRHKEAVVKVDPYTLETEVLQTNDEYFYMQGPVTFDYLGRMYLSYMPDFFDEYEAHAGYLVRYDEIENLIINPGAEFKEPEFANYIQRKSVSILLIEEEEFHDLYDQAISMIIKSDIALSEDDLYEQANELVNQAQVIADELFCGGEAEHAQHLITILTKNYGELYIRIRTNH
jgi:rhodanese-related sulfurtransferase